MSTYESLLDDIHRIIAVAGHTDGDREYLTMIAVEERSEPLLIPSQATPDELPIVLSQIATSCLTAAGEAKFRLPAAGTRKDSTVPYR